MKKLIRDNIPEIAHLSAQSFYIAGEAEYKRYLCEKLLEESSELCSALRSNGNAEEEFADVLEVLETILRTYNLESFIIMTTKAEKAETKGGFEKRIIGEFKD